ncbi:MAG: hypothetical protein N4A40_13120 [Tissierellales bacterium]|jgi:glutathione peroxidase-family protein|nr:hypothetical protein [Tissierellales bacterium]
MKYVEEILSTEPVNADEVEKIFQTYFPGEFKVVYRPCNSFLGIEQTVRLIVQDKYWVTCYLDQNQQWEIEYIH